VVAVVNDIGNIDGGCVGVASDDVAVAFGGSRCSAGVRGTGWGELGVWWDCLADLWRFFAKRGGSLLSVTVSIVADRCREWRASWDVISSLVQVVVAVWVLDAALVFVSEVGVAVVAVSLVLGVVRTLRSTWGVISVFFVRVGLSLLGGSVWRAAHRRSGVPLVWEVVLVVVGVAWVLALTVVVTVGVVWVSTLVVVTASVWVSASSRITAPRKSAHAWAAIDRQSPAPCPSVSHFLCSSSFPFSSPFFSPTSYPSLIPAS
jgi:hypothetical protein